MQLKNGKGFQSTPKSHLDLVEAQVVELHVTVEVEAGGVAEQVRKVHDPLVDLHHLWLRCRLLLLLFSRNSASNNNKDMAKRERATQY